CFFHCSHDTRHLHSFPTRRSSDLCLNQNLTCCCRMQIAEDVGQRKGMLRSEREQHGIIGCRRLQLEVELSAEPFSQSQSPGLVRSEEHTSELQSRGHLVCRLLLEK